MELILNMDRLSRAPRANIAYNGHDSELLEDFMTFLVHRKHLDLVFICNENKMIHTHKLIFASVSQFLSQIINDSRQDIVIISLPGIDHRKLNKFTNFLYEGIMKIDLDDLVYFKDLITLLGIQLYNTEIVRTDSCIPVEGFKNDGISGSSKERKTGSSNLILNQNVFCKIAGSTASHVIPTGQDQSVFMKRPITGASNSASGSIYPGRMELFHNPMYVNIPLEKGMNVGPSYSEFGTINIKTEKVDDAEAESHEEIFPIQRSLRSHTQSSVYSPTVPMEKLSYSEEEEVTGAKENVTAMKTNEEHLSSKASNTSEIANKPLREEDKASKRARIEKYLEEVFKETQHPSSEMYMELARKLSVPRRYLYRSFFDMRRKASNASKIANKPLREEDKASKRARIEKYLEEVFKETQHPSSEMYMELARKLSVPRRYLYRSFYDMRRKGSNASENPNKPTLALRRKHKVRNRARIEKYLAEVFKETQRPSSETYTELARKLSVPRRYLHKWFFNMRSKGSNTSKAVKRLNPTQGTKGSINDIAVQNYLREVYKDNPCPSKEMYCELERKLEIPYRKIFYWFRYRQTKGTKKSKVVHDRNKDQPKSKDECEVNNVTIKEEKEVAETVTQNSETTSAVIQKSKEVPLKEISFPKQENQSNMIKKFVKLEKKDDDDDNDSGTPAKNEVVETQKSRARFTEEQRAILESHFIHNRNPDEQTKQKLAKDFKVSLKSITYWFENHVRRITDIPRRTRHTFSEEEKQVLEAAYTTKKHDRSKLYTKLAEDMNMPRKSIMVWFNNRRVRGNITEEKAVPLKEISFPKQEKQSNMIKKIVKLEKKDDDDDDDSGTPAKNEVVETQKSRARFTEEQRAILESHFIHNRNPDEQTKQKLAKDFKVSLKSITYWFETHVRRITDIPRRTRHTFSEEEKQVLEAAYTTKKHDRSELYTKLAEDMNMPRKSIMVWFYNRRVRGNITEEKAVVLKEPSFHKQEEQGSMLKEVANLVKAEKEDNGAGTVAKNKVTETQKIQVKFTEKQRAVLESHFICSRYPDNQTKQKLANHFKVSLESIISWFDNRRRKHNNIDDCKNKKKSKAPSVKTSSKKLSLEQFYKMKKFPSRKEYTELEEKLGVSHTFILMWFKRRRNKDRIGPITVQKRKVTGSKKITKKGQVTGSKKITAKEKMYLERIYRKKMYPDPKLYRKIARNTGLSESSVKKWFRCRQAKDGEVQQNMGQKRNKLLHAESSNINQSSSILRENLQEENKECENLPVQDVLKKEIAHENMTDDMEMKMTGENIETYSNDDNTSLVCEAMNYIVKETSSILDTDISFNNDVQDMSVKENENPSLLSTSFECDTHENMTDMEMKMTGENIETHSNDNNTSLVCEAMNYIEKETSSILDTDTCFNNDVQDMSVKENKTVTKLVENTAINSHENENPSLQSTSFECDTDKTELEEEMIIKPNISDQEKEDDHLEDEKIYMDGRPLKNAHTTNSENDTSSDNSKSEGNKDENRPVFDNNDEIHIKEPSFNSNENNHVQNDVTQHVGIVKTIDEVNIEPFLGSSNEATITQLENICR